MWNTVEVEKRSAYRMDRRIAPAYNAVLQLLWISLPHNCHNDRINNGANVNRSKQWPFFVSKFRSDCKAIGYLRMKYVAQVST